MVRILVLDSALKAVSGDLEVTFASPDDVIYQTDNSTSDEMREESVGLYSLNYTFPVHAKEGMWKITVRAMSKHHKSVMFLVPFTIFFQIF